MYLDNSSIEDASGVYPIDDDDYASASGSGKSDNCFTLAFILHAPPTLPPTLELTSGRQARCIVVKSMLFGVKVFGCEFWFFIT